MRLPRVIAFVVVAPLALGAAAAACASSSPASPCATLDACCSAITDPTLQGACNMTVQEDQSLPDSDATCQGSLIDFQSYCPKTSGSSSGSSGGGTGCGACVSWRQTGANVGDPLYCSGMAPRQPGNDVPCDAMVDSAASGYCECAHGNVYVDCSHPTATCSDVCSTGSFAGGPSACEEPHDGGSDAGGGATVDLGFRPSNLDLSAIDVTKLLDADVQTTSCTLGGGTLSCANAPQSVTIQQSSLDYGNTTIPLTIYVFRSLKIESSAILKITDNNPVAIVATGAIDIEGALTFRATGGMGSFAGGPHGIGNGQGETGYQLGASGGAYCGVGGMSGSVPPLAGGVAYGSPTIVPLVLGGGGGGGFYGSGGGGGGAIQLDSAIGVTVGSAGVITVSGGGGYTGIDNNVAPGGGSGGSILIEAPTVTVAGKLVANGGAGGIGPTSGQDGTNDSTIAQGATGMSGSPSTTVTSGNGSGGTTINGGSGATGNASVGAGGGGGAGRIRINTKSGAATLSGTVSPSVSTACATQGTLGQ